MATGNDLCDLHKNGADKENGRQYSMIADTKSQKSKRSKKNGKNQPRAKSRSIPNNVRQRQAGSMFFKADAPPGQTQSWLS